jgi:hypothetical protein
VRRGAYPIEAPFSCSILGQTLALPANIRLGWKGFPETNTLAPDGAATLARMTGSRNPWVLCLPQVSTGIAKYCQVLPQLNKKETLLKNFLQKLFYLVSCSIT